MSGSWKILAAVVAIGFLSASVHQEEPDAYVGQWERKCENSVTTLTLTRNHRLHLSIREKDRNVILHGDCHVTRDGMIYGIVTSVDSDDKEQATLIDLPFSFRVRVDEGTFIIRECYGFGRCENSIRGLTLGRYRKLLPTNAGSEPFEQATPIRNEDKKEKGKSEQSKVVVFQTLNLDKALVKAKASKKIVMIDFTATWCGWCAKMENHTFSDEKVRKLLANQTVAIKVDGDENHELAEQYKVKSYPCQVFINSEGKEVGRVEGFQNAENFLTEVKKLLK